jgi:5'-nucleotidase (lipoprotein e(P4) family)
MFKLIRKVLVSSLLFCLCSCSHFNREYQVGAYLWFQTSGEYRALCYQAYHLGKILLDRELENKHNRKRAVVFDIDETVLDNSYGGAEEIQKGQNWEPQNFTLWAKRKEAGAIRGAREFIQYAVSREVEVIYISNREVGLKEETFENLKNLDIPVKKENLYLLSDGWSKETRRQEVLKKYDIVLFFGDNLGDFHKDWDGGGSSERQALVEKHKSDFGEKFIILPNPLYGDWENSLPKAKKRVDLLKTHP